jgi:hypothetical protein
MAKNRYLVGAILLVVSLAFMGCDDIFTKPWYGSSRKYELGNIKLNAGNLDSWQKAAVGNPALALALAKKIQAMLENDQVDNAEKGTFIRYGVNFAIEASGLGTSLLSNMDKFGDVFDSNGDEMSGSSFQELYQNLQKGSKGPEAANTIVAIAKTDIKDNRFTYNKPTPSESVQAVIILTMALIGNEGVLDENGIFDVDILAEAGIVIIGGVATVTGPEERKEESATALAAYLNYIAKDDDSGSNPVTSAIKSAFKM